MDVPQLWEFADGDDVGAQAAALAAAQGAEVGLPDRLRGCCGQSVTVTTVTGRRIRGLVADVLRDAVLLAAWERDVVVPLSAVMVVTGPPRPPAPPRGRQRAGGLALLRDRLGASVTVRLRDGSGYQGDLLGVGADHLLLPTPGGVTVVAWAAVAEAEI